MKVCACVRVHVRACCRRSRGPPLLPLVCSDGFFARISDEDMTDASDGVSDIPTGMDVCLDKGFHITALLVKMGCGIIQPQEKPRTRRYSSNAAAFSARVSKKRIHIERWVRRVKELSPFMSRRVPLNQSHLIYAISQVCTFMGNFKCPIRGG